MADIINYIVSDFCFTNTTFASNKKTLSYLYRNSIKIKLFKATLVAFFFVSLCRSFDEKNEMDSDEDDLKKLNEWNGNKDVNII